MSVSRVTLTVYITGFSFKLSEIKTLFFLSKTVSFWHSGIEFRPGLQSLFIPVLWYFICSPLHSDLQFLRVLPSLFYLLWFPEVQRYRLALSLMLCCLIPAPRSLPMSPYWVLKNNNNKENDFLLNKEISVHTSLTLRECRPTASWTHNVGYQAI